MLDEETKFIGKDLRAFINKTCHFYDTRELKREVEARKRRKAKKQAANAGSSSTRQRNTQAESEAPQMGIGDSTTEADDPKSKTLNINTYKAHSLGDYAKTIRHLGTTDSYSTMIVSSR